MKKQPERLVILMPLYNDWTACSRLLSELEIVLREHGVSADVLIVNDASTDDPSALNVEGDFVALTAIRRLDLRRNLGHQRAICIGLAYIHANIPCDTVIVMDSDGEDNPADVPRLLQRCRSSQGKQIVFAERTRRTESLLFRSFYSVYRFLYRLLTGYRIRFGNFSAIPRERLNSLVVVSELWNQYVAAIICSRQPFLTVPTCRARRYDGRSKMNFVALVNHGLSGMAVFSDIVGVRLAVGASALTLLSALSIAFVIAFRMFTALPPEGWATYTAGILLVVFLQSLLLSVVFSFVVLSGRKDASFIPMRDYAFFIGKESIVHGDSTSRDDEPATRPTPTRLSRVAK